MLGLGLNIWHSLYSSGDISDVSIENQTISFGALTLAGAGGIIPEATGASSFSIDTDDATAPGHWEFNESNRLVPTSTFVSEGAEASYTLVIEATNAGGSDTATITINTTANALSTRSKAETEAILALGFATIDGKTILGREGCDIGGAAVGDQIEFANSQTYTTGLTITSHDDENPCFFRRAVFRHTGIVTFTDLVVRDYFKSGDTHGSSRIWNFAAGAGRSEVVVTDCELFADDDISLQDYAGGNVAALKLIAMDGGLTNWPNLTVTGSNLHDFGWAITGTYNELTIVNNDITDAAADFCQFAPVDAIGDWQIERNRVQRAWGLSSDPQNPHMDAFQFNMIGVTTRNDNPIIVKGNRIMSKGGRAHDIQGIFIENQTTGEAYFEIEQNIVLTRSRHGITFEKPSADSKVRGNTVLSDTDYTGVGFIPWINIIDAAGAVEVAYNVCPDVALTNSASADEHNNHEFGTTEGANEDADYAGVFAGTDFGSDNIADFDALVTAVTPDVAGDLDQDINIGAVWYYDYSDGTDTSPYDDEDSFTEQFVNFDGTNDRLRITTDLTGAADDKKILIFASVVFQSAAGAASPSISQSASTSVLQRAAGGAISCVWRDTANNGVIVMTGTTTFGDGDRADILVSIDTDATSRLYVSKNGGAWASEASDASGGGAVLELTAGSMTIGARDGISLNDLHNVDMARVALWAGQAPDITSATVQQHFVTTGDVLEDPAVSVAQYGTPLVDFYGPASEWNAAGNNKGSGGDFAVTGTLTDVA